MTINQLLSDQPGIGHNQPPLSEVLTEETEELKKDAAELVEDGQRAFVTDHESSKAATVLLGKMAAHGKKIEAARVKRKQPFLDGVRTVDSHFGNLSEPLVKEAGRVKQLLEAFSDEEERKAAIERRRLEEEARRKQEEAAAAERERIAAEDRARLAALDGDVKAALAQHGARADAELRQRQAEEDARRLSRSAAQAQVAPINTELGVTAHRRSTYRAEITDWKLALRHGTKISPAPFREIVQKLYDIQVRALSLRPGSLALPGAKIVEDRSTIIRR